MPLTANTPKPMLIVKGKPILEHIVLQLRQDGFRNIVISVNYLSECITNYFNDGHDFGVNITYIHENKPLELLVPFMILLLILEENQLSSQMPIFFQESHIWIC